MNSIYNLDRQDKVKLFQEITNHFIGEKATLFAYSPGFRDLYISFEKGGRCFLFKFSDTTYIKTCSKWIFEGLKIELQLEDKRLNSRPYYKIYDRDYLEVICLFFWVFELFDDEGIVNASKNAQDY